MALARRRPHPAPLRAEQLTRQRIDSRAGTARPVGVMVSIVKTGGIAFQGTTTTILTFSPTCKAPHTLRNSLLLVDLLGKITLNDPLFGRVACVPVTDANRVVQDDDAC